MYEFKFVEVFWATCLYLLLCCGLFIHQQASSIKLYIESDSLSEAKRIEATRSLFGHMCPHLYLLTVVASMYPMFGSKGLSVT